MQKVSKAYKESMKSSLRERAYIMISFGLVNQEAQAKATVDNGSYAYYSNKDNIFGEHIDDTIYATLEEEFTKVDGSMFFLPRATEGGRYYDTGIVSDKLVSEARCEVVISLNTIATDFKGLTINFGGITRSISILSEVPGRPLSLEGIQNQSGVPRKYWKIQPISSWCSTR